MSEILDDLDQRDHIHGSPMMDNDGDSNTSVHSMNTESPKQDKSQRRDRLLKRWQCPACTYVNFSRHRRCVVCTFDSHLQLQLNESTNETSMVDDEFPQDDNNNNIHDSAVNNVTASDLKNLPDIEETNGNVPISTVGNAIIPNLEKSGDKEDHTNDAVSIEDSHPSERLAHADKWRCTQCTFENKLKNRYCEVCGSRNPVLKTAQKPSRSLGIRDDSISHNQSSQENHNQPLTKSQNDLIDSTVEAKLEEVDISLTTADKCLSVEVPSQYQKNNHVEAEDKNRCEPEIVIQSKMICESNEITCPKCTFNNPREFRFCDICGAQLEQSGALRGLKSPTKMKRPAACRNIPVKKERFSVLSFDLSTTATLDQIATDGKSIENSVSGSEENNLRGCSEEEKKKKLSSSESRKRRDRDIADYKSQANKRRRQRDSSGMERTEVVKTELKDDASTRNTSIGDVSLSQSAGKISLKGMLTPKSQLPVEKNQQSTHGSKRSANNTPIRVNSSNNTSKMPIVSSSARSNSKLSQSPSMTNISSIIKGPDGNSTKLDKATRAERAAEMQAIYDQVFRDPPPLKRGMVIVWDCGRCGLQNAIRELACLQCNSTQSNSYRYVALCTHFKALEGRRLKRLAELEGVGETDKKELLGRDIINEPAIKPSVVPTVNPKSSSSGARSVNNSRGKAQRNSSSHSAQGYNGKSNNNAVSPTSRPGVEVATSRSRRNGRANGEPRRPRVPIISQYPPKTPNIGPESQVDVDKLPNPAHFIKSKLDYTVYFDRLTDEQVSFSDISPWQFNNAYYEVLWMAADTIRMDHKQLSMSEFTIGSERTVEENKLDISASNRPAELPAGILLATPKLIDQSSNREKDSFLLTESSAAPSQAPTLSDENATSNSEMTVDNNESYENAANKLILDAGPAPTISSISEPTEQAMEVVNRVVAEVIAEVENSIELQDKAMTSTSFSLLAEHVTGPWSSSDVIANEQDGRVIVTRAENCVRGMNQVTLAEHYPVLALRSLWQHEYDLNRMLENIEQVVLENHRFVYRPHFSGVLTSSAAASASFLKKDSPRESLAEPFPLADVNEPPVLLPRKFYVGPLDMHVVEMSASDRERFRQALIKHGQDEWNAVAVPFLLTSFIFILCFFNFQFDVDSPQKELEYKFAVGQLQDYYYGTWSTKYRSVAQHTERLHRAHKRAASAKRPRRVGITSRELSSLLLDQELSNFLSEGGGGRASSQNRDRRRLEERRYSIVSYDPARDNKDNNEARVVGDSAEPSKSLDGVEEDRRSLEEEEEEVFVKRNRVGSEEEDELQLSKRPRLMRDAKEEEEQDELGGEEEVYEMIEDDEEERCDIEDPLDEGVEDNEYEDEHEVNSHAENDAEDEDDEVNSIEDRDDTEGTDDDAADDDHNSNFSEQQDNEYGDESRDCRSYSDVDTTRMEEDNASVIESRMEKGNSSVVECPAQKEDVVEEMIYIGE